MELNVGKISIYWNKNNSPMMITHFSFIPKKKQNNTAAFKKFFLQKFLF